MADGSTAADNCSCAVACPGASSCICIFVHDTAQCITECSPGIEVGPATVEKLSMDTMVNVDVRDVDRLRVAAHVGARCDEELFVSAASALENLTFTRTYVSLREVIEAAGVVVGNPRRSAT